MWGEDGTGKAFYRPAKVMLTLNKVLQCETLFRISFEVTNLDIVSAVANIFVSASYKASRNQTSEDDAFQISKTLLQGDVLLGAELQGPR